MHSEILHVILGGHRTNYRKLKHFNGRATLAQRYRIADKKRGNPKTATACDRGQETVFNLHPEEEEEE